MGGVLGGSVLPGTRGAKSDPKMQKSSSYLGWPPAGSTRSTVAQVFFAFDDFQLDSGDMRALDKVAGLIQVLTGLGDEVRVCCEGYADVRGKESYNTGLSERRADAVRKYLVTQLPAMVSLMSVQPFGEAQSHLSPADWARDRRVDVVLTMASGRFHRARVGFTFDDNKAAAGIISKKLEKMELDAGGTVVAWDEGELRAVWEEHADLVGRTRSPITAVVGVISFERYKQESRSRVTAYVETEYRFEGSSATHWITASVHDAVNSQVWFRESIKASSIVDGRTTMGLVGKTRELFDKLRGGATCISQRLENGWNAGAAGRSP
jgi:outer membrane protein OmpA-like peptidoglycan-associated protein